MQNGRKKNVLLKVFCGDMLYQKSPTTKDTLMASQYPVIFCSICRYCCTIECLFIFGSRFFISSLTHFFWLKCLVIDIHLIQVLPHVYEVFSPTFKRTEVRIYCLSRTWNEKKNIHSDFREWCHILITQPSN